MSGQHFDAAMGTGRGLHPDDELNSHTPSASARSRVAKLRDLVASGQFDSALSVLFELRAGAGAPLLDDLAAAVSAAVAKRGLARQDDWAVLVLRDAFGVRFRAALDLRWARKQRLHLVPAAETLPWGIADADAPAAPVAACGLSVDGPRRAIARLWWVPEKGLTTNVRCDDCEAAEAALKSEVRGPERLLVAGPARDAVREAVAGDVLAHLWERLRGGEFPAESGLFAFADERAADQLMAAFAEELARDGEAAVQRLFITPQAKTQHPEPGRYWTLRAQLDCDELAPLLAVSDWRELVGIARDAKLADQPVRERLQTIVKRRLAERAPRERGAVATARRADRVVESVRESALGEVIAALSAAGEGDTRLRQRLTDAWCDRLLELRTRYANTLFTSSGALPDATRTLVKLDRADGYGVVHAWPEGAEHPLGVHDRAPSEYRPWANGDLTTLRMFCGTEADTKSMRLQFARVNHGMLDIEREMCARCATCDERMLTLPEAHESTDLVGFQRDTHQQFRADLAARVKLTLRRTARGEYDAPALAVALRTDFDSTLVATAASFAAARPDWVIARVLGASDAQEWAERRNRWGDRPAGLDEATFRELLQAALPENSPLRPNNTDFVVSGYRKQLRKLACPGRTAGELF